MPGDSARTPRRQRRARVCCKRCLPAWGPAARAEPRAMETDAASAAASSRPGATFKEELLCPICYDPFREAVTLGCGHNFCRACVSRSWEHQPRHACPVCKELAPLGELRVNHTLNNLVEMLLREESRRGVPAGPALCALHREEAKLFCHDDKELVCALCQSTKQHQGHKVRPVAETAKDYRAKWRNMENSLRDKVKDFGAVRRSYESISKHNQVEVARLEDQIRKEFEKLHEFLRGEEKAVLAELHEEARHKRGLIDGKITKLSEDSDALLHEANQLQADLTEDDVSFLKKHKNRKRRIACTAEEPEAIPPGMLVDVPKFLGSLQYDVWKKMLDIITVAADNRFAPFLLGEPCRRHSTASMDPAQLHTAIVDVLNTSRTLVQYMLNQDLRTEASKRRIRQRGDDSDEDVDTELSQTAGPGALEILMVMGQILSIERRFWARETSTDWWDRIVLQVWDDSQWLRNFRMRKGTFMELCDLLAPALKRHNTKMRAALTVEKRVAIALWKLATPDSYRSVGNQFGVGKSTVGAAVMQVAKAITKLLLRKVVTLGNVQAIVDGFAAMGFPNCGGAIDGTHIPILAPQHQGTQYVNRKGYFSMVLQALVDHKGRFTNIHVGWPGRVHDARVFRSTTLFKRLQQGTYFPDQKITVGDVEMPVVILGDPAYPLMPWLMKPYTGSLDSGQDLFNYRLSKCRMVVECAFGRLKARWRTLLTRSDLSQTNVPYVIAACCILHNLCESKGETFMAGWEAEANHLAADYAQPDTREIRRAHQEAVRIREALKTSFINGQGTV